MILHGYFRSTAAWRVRIALNLKGLTAEAVPHSLLKNEQNAPDYLEINPQGLIPALIVDDGAVLTQSLAICEYLDEIHPEPPLLPGDAVMRARIRACAMVIACDTHPVQNLRVLKRLRGLGLDEPQVQQWGRDTIEQGLGALDILLAGFDGLYACGPEPTMADLFLVPQMTNARRFGLDLRWPRLLAIEALCQSHPAFAAAVPELAAQ
ncbi:maleylacetoacetate isomerase [soil metagenome]